ncbi:hypothetical protein NYZ21_20130, partial [Acinetobacter baumannii]|nr:hypothetical protein [Acinetobacter baumannii]
MSVGWVGAAAAVGGALISADSARSAANSQADAAQRSSDATLQAQREANDLQKYMYDTTRSDNQTFLQNGTAASNELALRLGLVPSSSNNTAASNNTYSNPDQSEA